MFVTSTAGHVILSSPFIYEAKFFWPCRFKDTFYICDLERENQAFGLGEEKIFRLGEESFCALHFN